MGGSTAGDVSYPQHMEDVHKRLLYGESTITLGSEWNVVDAMESVTEAIAGKTPYTTEDGSALLTAVDPSAYLTAAQASIDGFETAAEALTPSTDVDGWLNSALTAITTQAALNYMDPTTISDQDAILSAAKTAMGTSVWVDHSVPGASILAASQPGAVAGVSVSPTSVDAFDAVEDVDAVLDIDGAVSAYEARSKSAYLQAVSRVSSGFWSARASVGTQVGVALALLESERQGQLNDYDQQLRLEQVRLNHQGDMRKRDLTVQQALNEAQLRLQSGQFNSDLEVRAALRQVELSLQRDLTVYQNLQQQSRDQAMFDQRQIELEEQWKTARMQAGLGMYQASTEAETRLMGLRAQIEDARARSAIALASAMYQSYDGLVGKMIAGRQAAAGMQAEMQKTQIMGRQDEINWNIENEVRDALWDLELFSYGNSVMASVAGAPSLRQRDKLDRALQIAGIGVSAISGLGGLAIPLGSMLVSSDARAKRDIEDIPDALDKLLGLRGKQYHYRSGFGEDERVERMGFIAQEVEEIFPEWTNHSHAGYMYITVNPLDIAALITEAVRELTRRVEALEKKEQ